MNMKALGNGFMALVINENLNTRRYYYKGELIPKEILENMVDPDNPTEADQLTCEMAMRGE